MITISRLNRHPVAALAPGALLAYVLMQGGTWVGIMQPVLATTSLWLLAFVVVAWFGWRTRYVWRWHATPLDSVLPIWLIAFVCSTLANPAQQARIGAGLWFAGLYILAWYLIWDVLANRLITREQLVDGLLLAGLPVVGGALWDWLEGVGRIASYLGNPNYLGAILVLLIPLILGRTLTLRGAGRRIMAAYLLLAVLVAILTLSRGAWLGLLAAACVLVAHTRSWRYAGIAALSLLLILLPLAIRADLGRYRLYGHAIELFASQPLTGHGLFTYRIQDFALWQGLIHMHAHNAVLHIAAELGLPGLAALTLTMIVMTRAIEHNREWERRWVVAALIGTAVHHLVDFPIFAPAVALSGILILCVAAFPEQSRASEVRWPPWVLAALALLLWFAGMSIRGVSWRLI